MYTRSELDYSPLRGKCVPRSCTAGFASASRARGGREHFESILDFCMNFRVQ